MLRLNKNRITVYNEKPFRHWQIDNFFEAEDAEMLYAKFPEADRRWYKYSNHFEKKTATDLIEIMPASIAITLLLLNSNPWIKELETITGIEGLIPDPALRGGGLHQIYPGGKLEIHADFNYHKHLKLDRRLNLLVYLNKDWQESYGGHLELWDTEMKQCEKRILPILNRCVIFETTDFSYHGHPEPLTCPDGMTRKSLALYYYTNGRPDHEKTPPHSTKFQKRPNEETTPEIEALRLKRNEGRLA